MAAFESCCCCSLKTGSVFIGFISLAMSFGGGSVCVLLLMAEELKVILQTAYNTYRELEDPIKDYGWNRTQEEASLLLSLGDPELMYIEWSIIASLIFLFVCTVVDVLLIIGSIKETPWMLLPFMVVQWITIFLTIAVFGVILWQEMVAMPRYWWAVMFAVAVVILMVLSFVMVLSLYHSMKEREIPELYQGAEMVHRHIWLSQKGKYYD